MLLHQDCLQGNNEVILRDNELDHSPIRGTALRTIFDNDRTSNNVSSCETSTFSNSVSDFSVVSSPVSTTTLVCITTPSHSMDHFAIHPGGAARSGSPTCIAAIRNFRRLLINKLVNINGSIKLFKENYEKQHG